MEENLHRDEFELFLKTNADEYRMVPSKRIWYSLYNSMHPDRKWPSIAACIIILSAIMFIGISNNIQINKAVVSAKIDRNIVNPPQQQFHDVAFDNTDKITSTNTNKFSKSPVSTTSSISLKKSLLAPINDQSFKANDIVDVDLNTADNQIRILTATEKTTSLNTEETSTIQVEKTIEPTENINNVELEASTNDRLVYLNTKPALPKTYIPSQNNLKTLADKQDVENIKNNLAYSKKPVLNKVLKNTSITYFVAPSYGYRDLKKNNNISMPTANSIILTNRAGATDNEIIDGGALGLEAGAMLKYKISGNVFLKTGLQVNLTNYVSKATALPFVAQTTLAINNNPDAVRFSYYSTKPKNTKLNRSTVQVSLPIGADIKLASNGKVSWYAGASVQPTYIVSGSAFVLSADGKNYIAETSLLRNWNLNTAVETFVSYNLNRKVALSVGPQFRYQVISTYKKQYDYSEKIYNVGVKLGVTKSF